MRHEDESWVKELMKDMAKIDASMTKETPSEEELLTILNDIKQRRKQALRRELILFIMTALFILLSYLFIVYNLHFIFIWIQILSMITIPIIYFAEKKRSRSIGEVKER